MALFKKSSSKENEQRKRHEENMKNLDELRSSYKKAIEKYGTRYFPIIDLEERISHALNSKADIALFFKHEVDFFMSLVQRAESELQDNERKKKINEKFEEIMKSNNEKIEKYSEALFPYPVPFEIRHFSGAITDYMEENEILIESLFRGTPEWKKISSIISELERFIVKNQPSIFLNHYLQDLQTLDENEINHIERKILQTGGLNLHRIMKYIESGKHDLDQRNSHYNLSFNEYKHPELYEKWNNQSSFIAMDFLIKRLDSIINDFRLHDLVNHALSNEPSIAN